MSLEETVSVLKAKAAAIKSFVNFFYDELEKDSRYAKTTGYLLDKMHEYMEDRNLAAFGAERSDPPKLRWMCPKCLKSLTPNMCKREDRGDDAWEYFCPKCSELVSVTGKLDKADKGTEILVAVEGLYYSQEGIDFRIDKDVFVEALCKYVDRTPGVEISADKKTMRMKI